MLRLTLLTPQFSLWERGFESVISPCQHLIEPHWQPLRSQHSVVTLPWLRGLCIKIQFEREDYSRFRNICAVDCFKNINQFNKDNNFRGGGGTFSSYTTTDIIGWGYISYHRSYYIGNAVLVLSFFIRGFSSSPSFSNCCPQFTS